MREAADSRKLAEQARSLDFELCGIAPAAEFAELQRLPEWLERGFAGEMRYLHDPRRARADGALQGARSIIVCGLNYNAAPPNSHEPDASAENESRASAPDGPPRGCISRYAWGEDYHEVLGSKLDGLLAWMRVEFGGDFHAKYYVDTGPVLERVAAKYAGLGWLGKNTLLLNQRYGSWFFLGVIVTDLELSPTLAPAESPPPDLCGTCTRCIDACPTGAIVAPYLLDARRCFSYLTIELRGTIPEEFRPGMGDMVFGCDICQDVCPWNRKAPITSIAEFSPRENLFRPPLEWLISMSKDEFRESFRGSPVKRTKWRGLVRNACVALGNSRIRPAAPENLRIMKRLEELAASEDEILAEHARWALGRLQSQANAGAPNSPAAPIDIPRGIV